MTDTSPTAPLQLTIHPLPSSAGGTSFLSGGADAPSFKDLLDTINPLQHIPIVSSVYQALTGDVPAAGANIIGGAIFGGPLGLVGSIFNTILQQNTGSDLSGNLMAALQGKPVPALQATDSPAVDLALALPPDHLSANQRAGYNAYVNASMLA